MALYADDDDDGTPALYVRVLVSDVGALHSLRDRALAHEFEATVTEALCKQPLKQPAAAGHTALALRLDLTQFAERYEASVLSLTQLTPHQKAVLGKTRGKKDTHVKAPAGGGKSARRRDSSCAPCVRRLTTARCVGCGLAHAAFIGLHRMNETLDADAIDTLHEPEPHAHPRIPVHSVHTVQQLQQLSCCCTVCAAGTSTSVPTSPS